MTGEGRATFPLAAAFERPDPAVEGLRVVATDVDGTLTTDGAIGAEVVAAVARLGQAGFEVIPVSGRPAGEVLGLCRYLPGVQRAVAENGLLEVVPDLAPRFVESPTDVGRLRAVGERLNRVHGAGLRLAGDAFCRMGDVAYERDGRDESTLLGLRTWAEAEGVHLVWSNVHVHLAEAVPDKGAALLRLCGRWGIDPNSVVTVGDALNDAGLFVPGRFGMTVGTADVLRIADLFPHVPRYVAAAAEGAAFLELAAGLLHARSS